MNKQAFETFDCILKQSDPEKNIKKLMSIFPTLSNESMREILDLIKKIIFSKHHSFLSRTQALLTLKCLLTLDIPSVFAYTNKKIILKMLRLIPTSNYSNFDGWVDILSQGNLNIFKLFVLALQCIEIWSEQFQIDSRGKPSQFVSVFKDLKSKNIEFPPLFLFNNFTLDNPDYLRRDLQRSKKLCKEIKVLINISNKKRAKILYSVLDIYQLQLEGIVESFTKKGERVKEDLILMYSEISEVISLYVSWKNNGYELKLSQFFFNEACELIEDIKPKSPPSPDLLSKSMENLHPRESLFSIEREEKDSIFREDSEINDIYKLREKLMDTEDLVQMYKADIAKLQNKYLETTEKKEELLLRISAILFSNRELNSILTETRKTVEDLTRANFTLTEDLEAYKSQNESLKMSIREIQENLLKLEKDSNKKKTYIESLEKINTELVAENNSLRTKTGKKETNYESKEKVIEPQAKKPDKNFKKPFPEIFMNPKLVGDIENSYNISLTDSDNEKLGLSISDDKDEEQKNSALKIEGIKKNKGN